MTQEQETVLLIKGAISELTADQQTQIRDAYSSIMAIEKAYPEMARFAIGLRGAELAAEGD